MFPNPISLSHWFNQSLYPKVFKSKSTIESDDDIEVITGNDDNNSNEVDASDKVCPETLSNSLMKFLTKSLAQMLVDDEDKPVHEIGTVPKGLRFKKIKVEHDCAHEDHPEASCPSTPVRLHFYDPIIPSDCAFCRDLPPRPPRTRRMKRSANSVTMMTLLSFLQVANLCFGFWTVSDHFP